MKKRNTLLICSIISGIAFVIIVFLCYKFLPVVPNQIRIGSSYMTMNNVFYKTLNNEIEKRVDENHDILYTRDPALNIDKQCLQIESFVDKKVDAIIINPIDSNNKKLNTAIKKAKDAGIKIVVVDTQLKDSSNVDSTIVSDNYKAGVLCAEDMKKRVDNAEILLLEHSSTMSATDRIKGFTDTIKGNTNYKIIDRVETLGQTEITMPIVSNLISKGEKFNVVMALNDQSAIGALAALKENNINDKIYVYGIDGSPDMKKLLQDKNEVTGTVAQFPVKIGQNAIDVVYDLVKGKKTDKEIIVPVEFIDKEKLTNFDIRGWQ